MIIETFDLSASKIDVSYCIDDETKERQLYLNGLRDIPRLKEIQEITSASCAIVAFGPSLNDTWNEIYKFKNIITGSGSHKFLLDKGVNPDSFDNWWHMECDPRDHKIKLLGKPHPKIQYLIADTCHPKLFDVLKDYNVKMWHIYDSKLMQTMPDYYKRGEVCVTGGSNVGIRQLTMARVLGFINIHVLGLDFSFPEPEEGKLPQQHAAFHPKCNANIAKIVIEDKTYFTTQVMIHYAREFWHEVQLLPDIKVVLHGNGMLQHWALTKAQEPKQRVTMKSVALVIPEVISNDYVELNRQLHESSHEYGTYSFRHAKTVIKLKESLNTSSVLDYGCGKGTLGQRLPFPIWEYDPAIPGKDKAPRPADLVTCFDVLEHIEPEYLDNVLKDLARCVLKIGYFTINMAPSSKTLADGRNAHLIQKDEAWWKEKLSEYFLLVNNSIIKKGPQLFIIVAPKK